MFVGSGGQVAPVVFGDRSGRESKLRPWALDLNRRRLLVDPVVKVATA
jgi:hypothetical protein